MLQIQFTKSGMLGLIDLYKKYMPMLKGDPAVSNIDAAKRWSIAGYDGWPAVSSPVPDRDNCDPCPSKTDVAQFRVSWYPHLNPYSGR